MVEPSTVGVDYEFDSFDVPSDIAAHGPLAVPSAVGVGYVFDRVDVPSYIARHGPLAEPSAVGVGYVFDSVDVPSDIARHGPLAEPSAARYARNNAFRSGRAVKVTKVAAKAIRINRARAVHSHAAHGPARAASGGEDGPSGSSSDSDGPPRRSGGAKDDPALTSEDVRALSGSALSATRLDFPNQPKSAAISHAGGRP